MDEFIARLNIEHYREVLADECDAARRQLISRLLAEEEARLAAIKRRSGEHQSAPAGDQAVSHLNLSYYRKRLEHETDLVIRQILIRMIEEEEARSAPAAAPASKTCGGD